MISYYDIRVARTAMRSLQNKPLRRRKLDIHFSIQKDNPLEKDVNQGTLVVFNLGTSVTNDDLLKILGTYLIVILLVFLNHASRMIATGFRFYIFTKLSAVILGLSEMNQCIGEFPASKVQLELQKLVDGYNKSLLPIKIPELTSLISSSSHPFYAMMKMKRNSQSIPELH